MTATIDHGPVAEGAKQDDFKALRSEIADLRARLDTFERILQLRDATLPPAIPDPSPTPLPPTHDIAADQLLAAQDGFHQLEWGSEGAFRWTGAEGALRFEAWVDRAAPLVATLRLFHFGTPANAREMTVEVEGMTLALKREGSSKVFHSEPIPPRPGTGPTILVVKVPHLHSPADQGRPDKRILGVAFQSLRLAPA
ncbi:hypothetical protein J5Y09_04520 [Roseomonas sp. PWR1]|uniref:Uncharacterized protein n=1 Tax=Roseomonas nitratireducens TaxID=2820810 RepID=A0ABS4AP78_9PROT|nr:hypothetical protein [Neoroseomonas nitratireducens]MBP0463165.1 hypothetical protein [Neoroseomonas nitratireducens]